MDSGSAGPAAANDPACAPDDDLGPPHRVSKLYYKVWTTAENAMYAEAFGPLIMPVDGVERRDVGWPDWSITTRLDTADYWRPTWEAILRHRSQVPADAALLRFSDEQHRLLWGVQSFIRAFSLVNSGRTVEHDLFEGLR